MEKKFLITIGIVTLILTGLGVFFLGKQKPINTNDVIDQAQLLKNARNTKGNSNAPVTIVEFADFQCPACAASFPVVKNILEKNQGKIYFVYKHYPLPIHKNAKIAAQSAEAAANQGKFWEMHNMLFEKQKEWTSSSDPKSIFEKYAQNLELDTSKFKEDLEKTLGLVNQDYVLGNNVGVNSTPTFFINGERHPGVLQENQLQALIDKFTTSE